MQPVWSGLANDPCVKIGLRTNVTVPSARIGRIAENSSHAKPAKNQNSPAQVHSTSIGHDVGLRREGMDVGGLDPLRMTLTEVPGCFIRRVPA